MIKRSLLSLMMSRLTQKFALPWRTLTIQTSRSPREPELYADQVIVLMVILSLRAWVIGLTWAIIIPGLNQFFFFRFPSVNVTPIIAQLLSYPVGVAAAAWLPRWKILGVSLNPGPFTVKEHVLITVSNLTASCGATLSLKLDHGRCWCRICLRYGHYCCTTRLL